MYKLIVAALTAVFIAGCVTTRTQIEESPTQRYRPAGAQEQWTIAGKIENVLTQDVVKGNTIARTLSVFINGEEALKGQLSMKATGEVSGKYKDHLVDAICSSEQTAPNWIDVNCMILVDNERAATLTF